MSEMTPDEDKPTLIRSAKKTTACGPSVHGTPHAAPAEPLQCKNQSRVNSSSASSEIMH